MPSIDLSILASRDPARPVNSTIINEEMTALKDVMMTHDDLEDVVYSESKDNEEQHEEEMQK